MAVVRINEKFGCIDIQNNEVIPIIYDYFWWLENDIIDVKYGKWRGFLNLKGEVVKVSKKAKSILRDENCMDETDIFTNKIKAFLQQHYDYFSQTRYGLCEICPNGLLRVSSYDKYGYIDKDCKEIIPPIYDDIAEFHEGFLCAEMNGKREL